MASEAAEKPWEVFSTAPAAPEKKEPELQRKAMNPRIEPERTVRENNLERVALAEVKPRDAKKSEVGQSKALAAVVVAIEPPVAQCRDPVQPTMTDVAPPTEHRLEVAMRPIVRETSDDIPVALLDQIVSLPKTTEPRGVAAATRSTNAVVAKSDAQGETELAASSSEVSGIASVAVPDAYRLRVAPNRADIVQSRGGTSESEAAVKAALRWLVNNQAADGRWDRSCWR